KKVCSEDFQQLLDWARLNSPGTSLVACSHCSPPSIPAANEDRHDRQAILSALDALKASDFVSAFDAVGLHKHDRDMLQTHYHSPGRTITASQMARQLAFGGFGAANLHYGALAKRIGKLLGLKPALSLYVLATFDWPEGECDWIMRPQVAEALAMLRWVDSRHRSLAEEVPAPSELIEGAAVRVSVNAYERNPVARQRCINHYTANCFI